MPKRKCGRGAKGKKTKVPKIATRAKLTILKALAGSGIFLPAQRLPYVSM